LFVRPGEKLRVFLSADLVVPGDMLANILAQRAVCSKAVKRIEEIPNQKFLFYRRLWCILKKYE
jgi:hypothetical protein